MTDKDTIEMTAEHDGREYAIAYSLKEQKRSNDLAERWQWIIIGIWLSVAFVAIGAIMWLHINNIPTRILG